MMIHLVGLCFLMAAAACAAPPMQATIGVARNSPQFPPPPEFCAIIKHSVEGSTGSVPAANTDFVMHYGQRFIASSNSTICRIYLKCGYSGSPGTNAVVVSIYSHDSAGNGTPNLPIETSTPVRCSTMPVVTAPYIDDSAVDWTRFDIAPVDLVSGTTYWVVAYEPKTTIQSGNMWHWYRESGSLSVLNNEVNCNANVFPGTPWGFYNDNTQFKYRLRGQDPL